MVIFNAANKKILSFVMFQLILANLYAPETALHLRTKASFSCLN